MAIGFKELSRRITDFGIWIFIKDYRFRSLDSRDGPLAWPESQLVCITDLRILR